MAGRREGVELLAGELPAVGDQLGADALRNEPGRVTSGDAGPERVLPVAWLPMGTRLIDSTPEAMTRSQAPLMTACPAKWMACWLLPALPAGCHRGTDSGSPATSTAHRAVFALCSPVWPTVPKTTSSIRAGSIAAALQIVGDRWSLLAVREVLFGNHRFSQIARNTGAPRDRLAARLKALVQAGVLEKREYSDTPPRSDYHLTRAGRELTPVLQALLEWGGKRAVAAPPIAIQHHDHPLRSRTVCATCGQPVRQRDVRRVSDIPGWDITGPSPAGPDISQRTRPE